MNGRRSAPVRRGVTRCLVTLPAMLPAMLAATLAIGPPLAAQGIVFTPRVQPEWRAEVVMARHASSLVMAGANVPIGYYVRAGAAVGAGAVSVDGATQLAQRADVTLRFLLDPFAETRWGPYAGGGLTVQREGAARAEVGLLLVLGVEGRRVRRWTPSAEFALGEGARLAIVLRRNRTNGR